jgi:hypothetical protein
LKALRNRLEGSLKRKEGYSLLFSFCVFVVIFVCVSFLQRDSGVVFSVEDAVRQKLFSTDTNTRNQDDTIAESIPNVQGLYSWLASSIIGSHEKGTCGNGICEGSELPSFGRWGCRVDCGQFSPPPPNAKSVLTKVEVHVLLKEYASGLPIYRDIK